MPKKRLKQNKHISNSKGILIDRESYLASVAGLNTHLEHLMAEYEKLYIQTRDDGHPILRNLLEQINVINSIVSVLEHSVIHYEGKISVTDRKSIN